MKFTPGIAVGALSGSQGGVTASHNRYGAYFRVRAIPHKVITDRAVLVKQCLTDASQQWRALSANSRAAWRAWALENPVTDHLGNAHVLSGNAAHVRLNARILQVGGTQIAVPPLVASPAGLTTSTLTADIGAGTSTIVYAVTPVPASHVYQVRAALVNSGGINYFANLFRWVTDLAPAAASPYDYQAAVEAIFGPMVVGQHLVVQVRSISKVTGLASGWQEDRATVSSSV